MSNLPSNHNQEDTQDLSSTSIGTCSNCSAPILDKKSAFYVKDELYHQSCITCHICQVILTTHVFFTLDGKFYCDADFNSVAVRCTVCENPIRERVIETSRYNYHPECFRCTQCLSPLDGQLYTTDAMGNIFCIEDFHRKYAPKCHLCKEPIIPLKFESETSRIVALDRSYHPECYRCADCRTDLMHPDSLCYWIETGFYCKNCRDKRVESHIDSLMVDK
ncbi:Thyroid receptor-interacting protein 6-like [Oopsacas minuta]|uniref:Thyroid receptor-interacting protein 6-like n=1 Tax=Oopsacas minuta TaxID=111878 RepID=A0AAV7K1H9_9METZ|nr:Thyroid receptor-interacting protein 6-like [Oopsacas minuta]